jgi:bifunctional non-homologous end joining protein LigD
MQRADAVAYYEAVQSFILPHLRNRPVSFKRFIHTIPGEFFWEKDAPSFTPAWVKRFPVPRREGGPPIDYILINDAKTLLWIAGAGGIEIHPFLHKVPRIDVATHVVFDLDPGEGAGIRDCARVALLLRDALREIALESLPKVSGSKGLQVYVPLHGNATYGTTGSFARVVAEELARGHPKLVVANMSKLLRRGKVFIDWSQNADYKTTVGVYSLRATGLVSMPVTWEELRRGRKLAFTAREAIARLKKVGDLFAPSLTMKQKLKEWGGPPARRKAAGPAAGGTAGRRPAPQTLPKPGSQSGRRLFVLTKTELLLEMQGRFTRWILGPRSIAKPAGNLAIDPAWYRDEIPSMVEDRGAYEIIEGSFERGRFELWFSGQTMRGAWTLEKGARGWRLRPRA